MDLDDLARAYWAATPYDEHDHSDGFEKHPFDSLQDLQLDATDEELSWMLRSLALTAPSQTQLASVGSQWVTALEYKFDAEGDPGKSVRLLLAAGLEPDVLLTVLSGIHASWLRSMGAAELLADALAADQISSLVE